MNNLSLLRVPCFLQVGYEVQLVRKSRVRSDAAARFMGSRSAASAGRPRTSIGSRASAPTRSPASCSERASSTLIRSTTRRP